MTLWLADSPMALLFSWTRWLRLRHPTIQVTNVHIPLFFLALFIIFGSLFPWINVYHELGIVQQVNGLLQILAPFFVAALVLIVGFPGENLDKPVGGQPPYYRIAGEIVNPTRRETLSYLFAYLAGASIVLYLVGGLSISAVSPRENSVFLHIPVLRNSHIILIAKASYGASIVHLFAVTLLGLHFLANFMSASNLPRVVVEQVAEKGEPLRGNDRLLKTGTRPTAGAATTH